jgi:hypothetical protein
MKTYFCSMHNIYDVCPADKQYILPLVFVKEVMHLGQQHGLQNTTLTSLFYKNIYRKVIYVYFYGNDLLIRFSHFYTQ